MKQLKLGFNEINFIGEYDACTFKKCEVIIIEWSLKGRFKQFLSLFKRKAFIIVGQIH